MPAVLFVTDPYIEHLLEGVVDYAREHCWALNAMMRRSGRFPEGVQPDGIIATIEHEDTAAKVAQFGCPVVQILCIHRDSRWPLVMPDYKALGRAGARHLLALGRPQFLFYRRFDAADSNAVRDGFLQTMREAGQPVALLDYPARKPVSDEAWEAQLSAFFSGLASPCAIMAEDDRCAAQLIRLAMDAGRSVPADVAVIGCDNHSPDIDLSPVPLTSVDSNLRGMGFAAAALLDSLMQGKKPPAQPLVIPPRGVVDRASTAAFTCRDARIAATVCRIRRDFAQPLSVSSLAREARMSLRSLQTAFKAATGHAVRDELLRCRLERAALLLETTDVKVHTVAVECGLGDAKSLARHFRRAYGQTPAVWRDSRRKSRSPSR